MARTDSDYARLIQRVRRLELTSNRLIDNLFSGQYRSVFRGPGIEFDEVREYSDGDDARLIDWNVTSRMDRAFSKTYREEREMLLFLLVDVSGSLRPFEGMESRFDTEATLLALLTFAAVRNNDRVGAAFFSDRIEHWVPPLKGKKHGLRIIQDLLSVQPQGRGSDLSLALRTVGESLPRRGICVVLSDFKTSNYYQELRLLARRHDTVAIRIVDSLDVEFPKSGILQLEDPESGREILASGSKAYRNDYRYFWQIHRKQWLRECSRRGVSALEVRTDEDPARRLIHFFRRRR
ncbi:MAG: DUF58 domain-containing protein [Spirochaetaceae bacterium]|nr:MAG: DUF58 domain-containing protein [Spirochaetaceae bacterium]